MTITLATIRSLVRSAVDEATEAAITNTELDAIINDAYRDAAVMGLCNEVSQPLTLREGWKIHELPAGYGEIVRVGYAAFNGIGLLPILPQLVGRTKAVIDAPGTPRYWFQWGPFIVLEPAPDATAAAGTMTLFGACLPLAKMTATTDQPLYLPPEFHPCIGTMAEALCNVKLRRWADAAAAFNRYIRDVQIRRLEYIRKHPESKALAELPDNVVEEVRQ